MDVAGSRMSLALNPGASPKPSPRVKERKPLKASVHRIPDSIREQVLKRDGYTCCWCRAEGGRLDVHHVIRRSQGGRDEAANLRSLHRTCHSYVHEHPLEAKRAGFLA